MGETTMVCRVCKSTHVQRTRTLGRRERLRKRFTRKRVHVCLDCGWRGWLAVAGPIHAHTTGNSAWAAEPPPPDLNEIDAVIQEAFGKK
jgi:hypothetical protein